jgi:hypothetical protein
MAKAKKRATAKVATMLRMREELRNRLDRESKKNDRSMNSEMVARLEGSFQDQGQRDSAIIDIFLGSNAASSEVLRRMAIELAQKPDWSNSEADKEMMIKRLIITAFGREMSDRDAPLHEPWETAPKKIGMNDA